MTLVNNSVNVIHNLHIHLNTIIYIQIIIKFFFLNTLIFNIKYLCMNELLLFWYINIMITIYTTINM